ncbi:NAD(P)/FAD-dependent oxidoreductase [Microbacterium oryzae]|uniref:NAD(P)/FAD-dependent oxidoreductase n=1 Tax=Microbacterium oryzae TaxID=743009 RepID=UPI0025B24D20|nr:NAD(P)/FAD-dependent oxidoreductase [Microbacterium oryzae]MDN3310991.1 NAD(P)/FAD-dependent oxidoreductase [Microbacterium oryzae]
MISTTTADLVVVGAGPAGLSAAVAAAELGLRVTLVDAGAQTGGQYWRHPDERHRDGFDRPESTGHHHWDRFTDLRARLAAAIRDGRIRHVAERQVWRVDAPADEDLVLHTTAAVGADAWGPEERAVRGRRLLIATGAYDRQLPVPGWTLPGVMAAGGVQALLKAHQVTAGRRAVVAGTGPFLLSVAAGLAEAGVEVVAVCDANALSRWAATPLRAVQEPGKLLEGVGYAATFLRHRIPLRTRTVVSEVHGGSRVSGVVLQRVDARGRTIAGSERPLDVDLVAFGWGFTPQLELAVGMGLRTRVDVDESLIVDVDGDLRTSDPRVFAAGEATGIGGAIQSCAEGELAARAIAADLGRGEAAREVTRLRRRIARGRRFAVGMHRASPAPAEWSGWLRPDTLVCRCEEVTVAEVADTVSCLGADDSRDVRVTARPGMGWCQGRVCGFAVSKLVSERTGIPSTEHDLEPLAKRPVGVPIRLGEIADLMDSPHKEDTR